MSKIDQSTDEGTPQLEEGVSTEMQKIAEAEAEVREYQGLCSTCKDASACTYRRDPRQPIWQCDEFECETPLATVSPPTESPFKSDGPYKSSGKYKGLCVNCESRETCTYPKPEGGVWHCEEYA